MNATIIIAIVLSAVGAIFELVGLGLVAREIASDRRRGSRLVDVLEDRKRPERQYPSRRLPGIPGIAPPEYAMPYYTSEHQLSGVIEEVQQLERRLTNGLLDLRKAGDAELDAEIERMRTHLAERDEELRDGLRYVLAGSTRSRWTGVALLGLGIVLATAGSIVGNLA